MRKKSLALHSLVAGSIAVLAATQAQASFCDADLDASGSVGAPDLALLLGAWGPNPGSPADFDSSGTVDAADLAQLLGAWNKGCSDVTGVVELEMASNPLTTYPFAEFVKAFNEGTDVSIAIDPGNAPVGDQTADVYIVEARTESQWAGDASLTDVRGAPQSLSFGGALIQANTFTLTDSDTLSGDAGIGLGVGYDLVCDFNENGMLDDGDYIDGLGDEAGFYVVADTVATGPLAVTELDSYSVGTVFGIVATRVNENTFYPTNIGSMGALPIVIVSHGNGHQYIWYDHIAEHMASYGYVVMSHQNNTGPGVESAATTITGHSDAFLDQQDTIGGGVLNGHLDSTRITWIGHSRGAEGIAIAYDRIIDGVYVPTNYSLESLTLLSSMAPTDFQGPGNTNPHGANYHLWTAAGDADVSGGPGSDVGKTYHLFERATGWKQSTTIQGIGHGDLHAGTGGDVFSGPCHITPRSRVHDIQRGYFLPLIKFYNEGNYPARDFLTRQWESFKPIGAPDGPVCATTGGDTVVVTNEFHQAPSSGNVIVDDYQSNPDLSTSSSGGAVAFSVSNLTEGLLRESDGTFTWNPSDPMNGMTRSRTNDDSMGIVFDWNSPSSYTLDIPAEAQDATQFSHFSFRACQQTQHPNTTAEIGDLVCTLTLEDGSGASSSINIGAYGGGIEEVYQRSNGWANEFESVRIRLTDFTHNGSGIDLSDLDTVSFDFGDGSGSELGRIGLDAIEFVKDVLPPPPGAISMTLLSELPTLIAEGAETDLSLSITATSEDIVEDSALVHYRFDGGIFETAQMVAAGGTLYDATIPGPICGDVVDFYFSVEGSETGVIQIPPGAPADFFSSDVGEVVASLSDDLESDLGWSTAILGATSGQWQLGVPVDDPGWDWDPATDSDGSGQCWLTQNEAGNTDIDGGAVELTSYMFAVGAGQSIGYDYFLNLNDEDGSDMILVEGNDGTSGWVTLAVHNTSGGLTWRSHEITAAELADAGISPSATMQLRYTANDGGAASIVEAGIDALKVFTIECD